MLEHIGLGRYGDQINPNGHIKGFNNILRMLKPGGTLYVSFPISSSNITLFNSQRSFHPLDVLSWANDKDSIELIRFDYVDIEGNLRQKVNIVSLIENKNFIAQCGIHTFRKVK